MAAAGAFETYLFKLRGDRADKTEHSDRGALQALLEGAAAEAGEGFTVLHEAKGVRGKGAPDFKVTKAGMIVGYVEVKTVGENLDEILKSDQIARYKQLSRNIVLTDYLQFIRLQDGKVAEREMLAFPSDLEGKPKKPREDRAVAVAKLLRAFFSTAPEGIARAEKLALALATRSHFLRDFLGEELERQEKEHREGKLFGLFEVFKTQVFHELTLADFADAFAQMLAYGLFLARLNSGAEIVTLANAKQFVPGSFRLIRELVQFLDELDAAEYAEIRWVIVEILSIVNGLDLAAIHTDLSFKNRKAVSRKVRAQDEEEHRLFERDPFIYFYEDFLGKYDSKMKKARGVYYTPPPIVNFIVRAVDDILKDTFGIADGLADSKKVTVLDFACGTGTFLLEVFEKIFDNIGGPDAGKAAAVVRDHMLKNVYGFEYLIAPYTIAHLKLSQYLADKGHPLHEGERLQVFLTNTLEPVEPQKNFLLPAISAEVESAQKVKDKPILVITGNPPYSGHSKNKGAWITASIDEYKHVWETDAEGREVRKPLGEKNSKWLQDDYVKFIRFAQMKMDAVDEGIVAVITNHSWLDNPTFRGMRQSLMRSFEQIYVLDLHGNAKKKERAPDGSDDQNVFDIEQGVAVSAFVKRKGLACGVWRGDLWGKRIQKYNYAADGLLPVSAAAKVAPTSPSYLFTVTRSPRRGEYERGYAINGIMPLHSMAIVSGHDQLAYSFSPKELQARLAKLIDMPDERLRADFNLPVDTADWTLSDTRIDVSNGGAVLLANYRPFDRRSTFFSGRPSGFHVRPRGEVMRHLLNDELALNACRFVIGEWQHAFASQGLSDNCLISTKTKERSYAFPLALAGKENLSPAFRTFLDARYAHHYSPEEILGCIYAVLHAPTYRARYAEFLRIDFPRIPFPEARTDFDRLSSLGWALVQAHLLREVPKRGLATLRGKGNYAVEKIAYSEADRSVAINPTQSFANLPADVWGFHIGGYQVLEKYLKSRKGRTLSLGEIEHVAKVADCLAFTIGQMAGIDDAYRAAFPDGEKSDAAMAANRVPA